TQVGLKDGMSAVAYLVPLLSRSSGPLDGRLSLQLELRGRGATKARLLRSLEGQGTISIDRLNLTEARLAEEIERALALPYEGEIGTITSDFSIRNRRVLTDDLSIRIGRLPIQLAGWTDFDGRLDYLISAEGLTRRLPKEARELLSEFQQDLNDVVRV